ncbi:fatty acid desaturase [Halobacteriovorax sp. HLS]|uniref:fatty acid desaturase n=1 Tax=Halobacteriovorax sp. HLS TaxID=2234000 RepID=UPI0013E2E49E|nr:fatty acid desaturase [Halobacteriovorax sp. HLS]
MSLCTFLLYTPFFVELSLAESIPWILLSCIVNFICNLINHNHAHVATFGPKSLNIFFDFWLTINRGASAIFIKVIHNINHHKYEGSEDDWFSPSNEGYGPIPLRPFVYIRKTISRFRIGAKSLYTSMGEKFNFQRRVENFLLVVIILLALFLDWQKFIFYVLIPWYFGNMFLVLTNLIFHKNTDPSNRYTLSNNYINPFENLIFLNGGYHTAHHYNPNIHWSLLKKFHDRKIKSNIDKKFIKSSMFGHLIHEYFRV